jgi:D-alanyl-D-alanine carboxypeptidase
MQALIRRSRRRGAFIPTNSVCAAALVAALLTGSNTALAQPAAARVGSELKAINRTALETIVAATAREMQVPGAVVLLRTPQGRFTVNYGTTQLSTATPPSPDTSFRIASNTKTMTAAVIMQLAQEVKLALSDPVSKYVADVPNGKHITVADLLDMRSGLYNYTDAPEISASMDNDPTKIWKPRELLQIAFSRPPNFAPGTAYEYCNTNYMLLGLIIEKVDRRPLSTALRARLFAPLGLKSTDLPPTNAIPKPYSHGYLYGSASVAMVGTPPYGAAVKAAARAGTLLPKDFTNINPSFAAGAGGAISTSNDLAVWIQALVAGRLLNDAYQRRWLNSLRPVDPAKPDGQQYGYGITAMHWGRNTMYFHGGEMPGYNSFIGSDPANGVTLVVWTNLTVSLDETPTANALMLKVLDHIYAVSPLASPSVSPQE